MANVLIIGCGYVGSALGAALAGEGHLVWGMRRNPENLPESIKPLGADVHDKDLSDFPPQGPRFHILHPLLGWRRRGRLPGGVCRWTPKSHRSA